METASCSSEKKKALKEGPIQKKDWAELVLYLKNGANCPCHQLDQLKGQFLVLGRKAKAQHLLTAIHKWESEKTVLCAPQTPPLMLRSQLRSYREGETMKHGSTLQNALERLQEM